MYIFMYNYTLYKVFYNDNSIKWLLLHFLLWNPKVHQQFFSELLMYFALLFPAELKPLYLILQVLENS